MPEGTPKGVRQPHHHHALGDFPLKGLLAEATVVHMLYHPFSRDVPRASSFPNCLYPCPGFGWDRVNFHKKPAGLTQTSQSNGTFDTSWCHAWYLSEVAGQSRVISYSGASWAWGGEKIALCIFFSSVLLFFSSPFAILLNCFYPNPQVLPFPSDSPPHPTGARRSERVIAWFFVAIWG